MTVLNSLKSTIFGASSATPANVAKDTASHSARVPFIAYPFVAPILGAGVAVLLSGIVDLVVHVVM